MGELDDVIRANFVIPPEINLLGSYFTVSPDLPLRRTVHPAGILIWSSGRQYVFAWFVAPASGTPTGGATVSISAPGGKSHVLRYRVPSDPGSYELTPTIVGTRDTTESCVGDLRRELAAFRDLSVVEPLVPPFRALVRLIERIRRAIR